VRRWGWTGLVLAACHGASPRQRAPEAVPVSVAPVVRRPAPVELKAIGSVEVLATVAIKSLVAGEILQVHFKEGDEVEKGALLFTIDPRPYQAALAQTQGLLARDQAQERYAAQSVKRYRALIGRGFVTQEQYAQTQSNAAALLASVRADLAAVQTARLNLDYCFIRAPFSGKTGELQVKSGNVVKANDVAMLVINQLKPIGVSFTVPSGHLPEIREQMRGRPLQVLATAPGVQAPERGRLNFVNNAIDVTTGTILLRAEFPNQDEALWPGQFVDVVLTLATQPDAILAPTAAIQTGQQGTYAFVLKPDQTVESRPVTVDRTLGDQSVTTKGLNPGEQVVTEGQLRLVPGTKVSVRQPAPSAPAGQAPQGRKP
jgi:multidrug efflux system membrane fusion protein